LLLLLLYAKQLFNYILLNGKKVVGLFSIKNTE